MTSETRLDDEIQTPTEQIELFCHQLRSHYLDGSDPELRVAAKLMLVALDQFRQWGGHGWKQLVQEYVDIACNDPAKFERILHSNRSEPKVD